jgi:hypothetical protein
VAAIVAFAFYPQLELKRAEPTVKPIVQPARTLAEAGP